MDFSIHFFSTFLLHSTTNFKARHSAPHTSTAMITCVHASGKQQNLSRLPLITFLTLLTHRINVFQQYKKIYMKRNPFFPENDTNHKRSQVILQTLCRENMWKGWDKAA